MAGFTKEEQMAMRARAKELAAEVRADKNRAAGESDVMKAIEAMAEPDQTIAKKIHEIVKKTAPDLWPKTWYGMPAYAKDGNVICFFQSGQKFQTRFSTFGFQQAANLDEGSMWPMSYAITKLTAHEEEQIINLIKRAIA